MTSKKKKMPASTQPLRVKPLLKPVFLMDTYREYLRYAIQVNETTRGFRSRLAEAASCQPSYLSQVLAGTASFSLDQLHGIARYLDMSGAEWEYLRELGILDRAASPKLREDCTTRIKSLRERGGAVASMVAVPDGPTREDMVWYASSYQHGMVFVSLSCEKTRTTAEIAAQHKLTVSRTSAILGELSRRRFATNEDGGWRAATAVLFWQDSVLYHANRMNWMLRAQQRRMEGYEDGLHLGAVTSMPAEAYGEWKKEFLSFWRRTTHALSGPAKEGGGDVVYLGLDFFQA